MAMTTVERSAGSANPLDVLEQVVAGESWPFERIGEDELNIAVSGRWCEYRLSFTWAGDLEALLLACSLEMKVPRAKRREVHTLLALVNERMWLGHFDLWSEDGVVLFRHGLMLQGGIAPTTAQCEGLIKLGVEACERFYPAFQYLIWGGKAPEDAMAAALFDCAGEA